MALRAFTAQSNAGQRVAGAPPGIHWNPLTGKPDRIIQWDDLFTNIDSPQMGIQGWESENPDWQTEAERSFGAFSPRYLAGYDEGGGDDWFHNLGKLTIGAGGLYTGLGTTGALGGASAAGGAMDMGIGGVGEAMGLGAGYTSPGAFFGGKIPVSNFANAGTGAMDAFQTMNVPATGSTQTIYQGGNMDITDPNWWTSEADYYAQGGGASPNDIIEEAGNFTGGAGDASGSGLPIPGSPDFPSYLKTLLGSAASGFGNTVGGAAGRVLGGVAGGAGSQGQSIWDQITGNPMQALFNSTPFLLALAEANKQGGDIKGTIGRMEGLYGQAGANQGPFLDAVIQPYRRQTVAGRDALMSSLGQRRVLGSSFGNQDLTSYDTSRSLGEGELAAKALTSSLGLQGDLAKNIGGFQTQAATNRNLLLGAGLSASGKLFQPTPNPFDIRQLWGAPAWP